MLVLALLLLESSSFIRYFDSFIVIRFQDGQI